MRALLLFISLLFAVVVRAQIGYEDFYSVKQLESNLRQAKTAMEQIDAAGILAVRYKFLWNDSLKELYLKQVFTIAENAKDIKAMGRALWWDLYYESSVFGDWDYKASEEKANKLFQFAEQHQLLKERISGNLLLADIGNGIPKNVIEKIFQPFFTTKPTGQGTGLGLSLAYDIIRAHDDEIKLETKEGEGAEFAIHLPSNKPS